MPLQRMGFVGKPSLVIYPRPMIQETQCSFNRFPLWNLEQAAKTAHRIDKFLEQWR